jgi:hypothetical protein
MWLLDKNIPVQLKSLLNEFGIESVTADSRDGATSPTVNWSLRRPATASPAFLLGITSFLNRLRAR